MEKTRLHTQLITLTGKYTTSNLPTGFRFEDTPSHGYYYVSAAYQKAIPATMQQHRYEEDCDWAIPVFVHRQLFTELTQQYAISSLATWHWQEFEQLTGIELLPGESYTKDKHLAFTANLGREYVSGAFGDWCYDVPKGFVYVGTAVAATGQTKPGKGYLIEKNRYNELMLTSPTYNWITDEFTPYERNTQYYRWEDYTKQTGQARTK